MKKKLLLASILLSFAPLTFAGKVSTLTIPVPDGGVVAPKGGSLKLPLNGILIDDVTYNVTCHASNPSLVEGMTFKVKVTDMDASIIGYVVNGNISSSQFNLTKTDNIITVQRVTTESYAQDESIIFQNLDNSAYSTISQCTATPVT